MRWAILAVVAVCTFQAAHAQDSVFVPGEFGEAVTGDKLNGWFDDLRKSGKELRSPNLPVDKLSKGLVGKLPYAFDPADPHPFVTTKILQVIDDKSCLLHVQTYQLVRTVRGTFVGSPRPEEARSFTLLVRNINTADVADDTAVKLPGAWQVTGTHSYETLAGKRTVHVIEPFNLQVPKE